MNFQQRNSIESEQPTIRSPTRCKAVGVGVAGQDLPGRFAVSDIYLGGEVPSKIRN